MKDDTISRAAAIDAINKALDRETLLNSFVRKVAVDAVKAMPSALPSATDTNVGGNLSVDELITFLNPESNYVFYDDSHGFCINTQDVLDHLCAMPSARLAQDLPNGCTDTISRQAAIDAIERLEIPEDMCVFEILSHIELEIGTLPSAQPVVISKLENTTECEDAVSREAVLNEIHRYMEERDYTIGLLDDNVCGLPPVTPKQPGWIPTSERLPDNDRAVLVTLKWAEDDYEVAVGEYWHNSTASHGWGSFEGHVIAWHELPTPYREGGQDGKN